MHMAFEAPCVVEPRNNRPCGGFGTYLRRIQALHPLPPYQYSCVLLSLCQNRRTIF